MNRKGHEDRKEKLYKIFFASFTYGDFVVFFAVKGLWLILFFDNGAQDRFDLHAGLRAHEAIAHLH